MRIDALSFSQEMIFPATLGLSSNCDGDREDSRVPNGISCGGGESLRRPVFLGMRIMILTPWMPGFFFVQKPFDIL
jgi:hypothetical protein